MATCSSGVSTGRSLGGRQCFSSSFESFLIDGLINTLLLSLAMIVGGTLFAIVFAAGLSLRSTVLSRPVYMLVECLRDIPLMVTVLLVYFVLPNIGISLNPFWSSALSVSVWGGANGAHIIRAGLGLCSERAAGSRTGFRPAWLEGPLPRRPAAGDAGDPAAVHQPRHGTRAGEFARRCDWRE